MNEINVIEEWNLDLPALPKRSRLCHLEPIGVGTPYTESLTSYITRLAEVHSVSPKALVVRGLLPMIGRPALSEQNPRIHMLWQKYAVTINGASAFAGDMIRALERLTSRSDLSFLTMLTWSGVIDRRSMLRTTQAWCPDCFGEWRRNNNCLYNPLLWSLKEVVVCPRHHVHLSTHCPHKACSRPFPILCLYSRLGNCPYCGHRLDTDLGSLRVTNEVSTNGDDLERQCWMANAIGELIEATPRLPGSPRREKLASSITQCSDQLADGSLSLLERRLGLAHGAIHSWHRQDTIPLLKQLLQLSFGLGISPRLLLIEAVEDYSKITGIKLVNRRQRKPIGDDELRIVLEACFLEEPPPSLKEVATRLGCNQTTLYRRFSQLCRAIGARYRNEHKSTRPRIVKARSKLALDELQEHLKEVLVSDETPLPSIKEIAKRLGYRSEGSIFHRAPDLCVAIAKKRRQQCKDQPLRQALEVALMSDKYPPPSIREIAERLSCSVERLYSLYPEICHTIVKRRQRIFDAGDLRRELEADLAETSPPPSVRDVARRVGFGESRLRRHFPELCSQISLRYITYRKNSLIAKRQHIRDKVKSAVIQLSVEGVYPSIHQVCQLLQGEKLSFVEVSKAWREVLRELLMDKEE